MFLNSLDFFMLIVVHTCHDLQILPTILTQDLEVDKDIELLVVASDGLWDVVRNEVCLFVMLTRNYITPCIEVALHGDLHTST